MVGRLWEPATRSRQGNLGQAISSCWIQPDRPTWAVRLFPQIDLSGATRRRHVAGRWWCRCPRSRDATGHGHGRIQSASPRYRLGRNRPWRQYFRLGVRIGRSASSAQRILGRVEGAGRDRSRSHRWRGLDAHGAHPRPLRRRLGVGPGEVRRAREILNVIVHIAARGQRHAGVFHLAADRRQDRARQQSRPKRHASPRGPSRRSHPGQTHRFHPPWRLRRSLRPIP
jgi:hypothetical protein